MDVLAILIPVSLFLGGLGLAGFYWTLKKGQYDDPEGDARRILNTEYDDVPMAAEERTPGEETPREQE